MIFAADLDGTLIFSERRVTPEPAVTPAEYRAGKPCGFMTQEARRLLDTLQSRAFLFVNTLRGEEQAKRVGFVRKGCCRYLACQNGLYLYRDGVLDTAWADRVARLVEALPMGLSDGVSHVLSALPGITCLSKQYAYLAVFFVEPERFDDGLCASLAEFLAGQGWELYRQRRKLYLSPQGVDKGTVLERVRELTDGLEAYGFGDSYFDLPMLRACARAYAPRGCELAGLACDFPIEYSAQYAQAGSEEILHQVLEQMKRS